MVLKIKIDETDKTNEQKVAETQQEIAAILMFLHTQILQGMTAVQGMILENPKGLTPQEVRVAYGEDIDTLDEIGIKAGELLAMVEVE